MCVRLLSIYFDDHNKSAIGATSDTEFTLFDLTVLTFPFPENGIAVLDRGLPAEVGVDTPELLFSLSLYWVCTLSICNCSELMFLSFCRITSGFGAWSGVCFGNLPPLARRRVDPLRHGHLSPWVGPTGGGERPLPCTPRPISGARISGRAVLVRQLVFVMDWYLFTTMSSVIWLSLS